jgi:membrane associated rhomboid family serine protease
MVPIFPHSSPTPQPLKIILWALLLSTLGTTLLSFFGWPLYSFLAMTLPTFSHGFIWTLLSYPFILPPIPPLEQLFQLVFDLILLWTFGASIMERIGQRRFLFLFFGSTLFGGLTALLGLYLWPIPSLFAGPSPALFALITAWTILHAECTTQWSSFLFRPLWIFLLLIGINLTILVISNNWTQLIANVAGILFGYAFCLISERTRSTIAFLYPFERSILRALDRCHGYKQLKIPKIIDFQTGEPILNDEQFMDAMLARISLHGEGSLSPAEKKRMRRISHERTAKKP